MKTNRLKLVTAFAALWATGPLWADETAATNETPEFAYTVPFELGDSEFAPGDSITIQELRGTSDEVRTGETYCVTGTYTLSTEASARLAFYATTTNVVTTPVGPQQTVSVQKGTGSFRLIKRMTEPGYLHLTFYAHGHGIGGVYFGQGQWVLRDKHWSYRQEASRSEKPEANEPISSAGPNEILYEYLGNPVAPPANLDAAYTREGLTQGMQTAAQNAGISLVKLEIDDSEFPCLVGVVVANRGDLQKLKEQIRKVAAFNYTGGVGGDTSYAMNLVPYTAFPWKARQWIDHRMMLREEILSDKINGAQ